MRRSILALVALVPLPALVPASAIAQVIMAPHAADVMLNASRAEWQIDQERKRQEAEQQRLQEQERLEFERQQEQALQPLPGDPSFATPAARAPQD